MGWWWWNSTSQLSGAETSSSNPSTTTPNPTATRQEYDRDNDASHHNNSLLQEISGAATSWSANPERTASNTTALTSTAPSSQSRITEDSSEQAITDDDLFEDTMSCRERFDRAFYCQSLGGQFNNLYRYGGLRDCSESWGDFWFCMKVKNNKGEIKRQKIQQYLKEKNKNKYMVGPSSEDVWEARTVKVEKAFDLDPDEVPVDG